MTNKEAIDRILDHMVVHKMAEKHAVKITEALRMAMNALKEKQWIPVSERLPKDDEDVLVCVNGTYRDLAYRDEGTWYDERHNHLKGITHWMQLPEPPKDGDGE